MKVYPSCECLKKIVKICKELFLVYINIEEQISKVMKTVDWSYCIKHIQQNNFITE